MIEIGVTDQNYGLWWWFPLSIFRRFELLTRLAPVQYMVCLRVMWKKTYSVSLLLGKKVEDENLEWA